MIYLDEKRSFISHPARRNQVAPLPKYPTGGLSRIVVQNKRGAYGYLPISNFKLTHSIPEEFLM